MSGLEPDNECNICSCEIDMESEGGVQGYIGILPFSLCPMCYSGLMDMYEQLHGEIYDDDEEDREEDA